MRTVTQLAPTAPAPPPPIGTRPPAPEASAAPFAAVLDDHKARTAVAEGQTPKRPTGAQDQASTTPSTPDARDAAKDATSSATPQNAEGPQAGLAIPQPTPPALIVDQALPAPAPVPVIVPSAAASAASPVPAAAPAGAAVTVPAQADVTGADVALPAGVALPGPTAGPAPRAGVPTDAGQTDTPATANTPAGAVALPADAAPADGTHAPDAASTADTPVPAQTGAEYGRRDDDGGTPTAARTMTPAAVNALRAAAPAASAVTTPDVGAGTAATGIAPAPTTTTTATISAPAAPAPSAAVPLQHAVETVRLTLGAAAQRGVTRARIALRPEELGGVEVHLRHTAEGLSARVVAEAPEAAHLLAQAAGELRRTLEQQGLNLVRLDIATARDDAPGTGAGAAGNERRDGRRHAGGRPGEIAGSETDQTIAERTIELPNGALVDVLA